MGLWLKQSTAVTVKIGPFIDDTDGKTAETGLTLTQADIRLSKNGANIAQKNEATNATTDELGYYDCPLDTTDTNTLGVLQLFVHETGALPVFHEYMVMPANVYNSLVLGSASDLLDVSVVQLGGVAQSLTDLVDFADTGYNPATHKVAGVVLVDTTTTNTDMITAAVVNTQCDTALSDIDLDHLVKTDIGAGKPTVGTLMDKVMNKAAGQTFDPTTDSLEAQVDVGVNVKAMDNIDFGATQKASINTEVDNALNTAVPASNTANSVNDLLLDQIDVVADAIKAKTDNLPSDPADESLIEAAIATAHSTTDGKIDAVDNYVDTEVSTLITNVAAALKILKNKWAIAGTTLTFYDDDGTTPLYQFTLDDADAPTSRTPV